MLYFGDETQSRRHFKMKNSHFWQRTPTRRHENPPPSFPMDPSLFHFLKQC